MLFARMESHDTLLCCGLDPDVSRFPEAIREMKMQDTNRVHYFLEEVIERTAEHVCAYKVQKAFFDVLTGGHELLREVIELVHNKHPGVPVIVDCKIGDIDNTMHAYIHNLFTLLNADGVVVNAYMGDDVMLPLIDLQDKAIVVLAKTSNPSGGIVQDVLLQDGRSLWEYMLDLTVNRWNKNGNMIPVVSSTVGMDLNHVRTLIPDEMPILLAGVGAQGGSFAELAKIRLL